MSTAKEDRWQYERTRSKDRALAIADSTADEPSWAKRRCDGCDRVTVCVPRPSGGSLWWFCHECRHRRWYKPSGLGWPT